MIVKSLFSPGYQRFVNVLVAMVPDERKVGTSHMYIVNTKHDPINTSILTLIHVKKHKNVITMG